MRDKTEEKPRWWSKLLIFSAGISVFLLISGPLGYRFGITPLLPSLMSLLVAMAGAVVVLLASIVMVIVANKNNLTRDRNIILISMGISLIPMIAMGPQLIKVRSVPAIHDLTTDTQSPPQFEAVVALRKDAPNSLEYELDGSAENLAKQTMAAYPGLKTLRSDLSVGEAVDRAVEVLTDQGIEIVNSDKDSGIVEATATTFWFGFKDDVVVRVRSDGDGSKIDVRSVSRVGQSDVGANAARIMKFLEAF